MAQTERFYAIPKKRLVQASAEKVWHSKLLQKIGIRNYYKKKFGFQKVELIVLASPVMQFL